MDTSLAKPPPAPLTSLYAASLRKEVVLPPGGIRPGGELHRLLHFILKVLPLIPEELAEEAARVHNHQPDCYNYLCSNHAGHIALFEEANELMPPLLSCILWALKTGSQPGWRLLGLGEGFIFWPAFAANLVDTGEMDIEKYISLIPHLRMLGFNPLSVFSLDDIHPLDGELLRFSFL